MVSQKGKKPERKERKMLGLALIEFAVGSLSLGLGVLDILVLSGGTSLLAFTNSVFSFGLGFWNCKEGLKK